MATQSHRSNEPWEGPQDGGTARIRPHGRPRSLPPATNHRFRGARATMTVRDSIGAKTLLFFALSLLTAVPALAINCVADAGGVVDGFVNYPVPPSQINIDGDCRIQNYPPSNPMTSHFNFDRTLSGGPVLLHSVRVTGNMAFQA